MASYTPSAFDAANPRMAGLADMRDEIAKESKWLQWKQTGMKVLGGIGGLAAGIGVGTLVPGMGPSLAMAGGAGGMMLADSAASALTIEQRKKLEINERIMDAEMSRINAQNWGTYYAASNASINTIAPPLPPVVALPAPARTGKAA
ncbi:MAG: hypothetical protein K2Q01_09740 [Rickettsiales bacterium]|nr:hypothetical protein [Rickettsiales bacterium]